MQLFQVAVRPINGQFVNYRIPTNYRTHQIVRRFRLEAEIPRRRRGCGGGGARVVQVGYRTRERQTAHDGQPTGDRTWEIIDFLDWQLCVSLVLLDHRFLRHFNDNADPRLVNTYFTGSCNIILLEIDSRATVLSSLIDNLPYPLHPTVPGRQHTSECLIVMRAPEET